jgi:hypothetical protein
MIVKWLQCAYISLDDINAERGLWGGDGISIGEMGPRVNALNFSIRTQETRKAARAKS